MERLIYKFIALVLLVSAILGCDKKTTKVALISTEIASNIDTIDSLNFISHRNEQFKLSSLKGQVHVVYFFFTSCKTICPIMENSINDLAKEHPDVHFVSFTIDPKGDNIEVLADYHHTNKNKNQTILRGNIKDLGIISKYYLSSINTNDSEGLFHTPYVVLLDKKLNIRGLYNSLEKEEIEFLKQDILILLEE